MFQNRSSVTAICLAAIVLCPMTFGANYALVVGVNECPQYTPNGARQRPLAGAEADADAFAHLLLHRYGFPEANVHLLTANHASHAAIANKFDRFKNELAENDQLVFYFAGHGTQVPDRRPYPPPWNEEADTLDETLCPHDAAIVAGKAVNLIVDDQLAKWVDGIKARQITVVLDCCHAGTGIKAAGGADIRERALDPPQPGPMPRNGQQQPWQDLLPVVRKGQAQKDIAALYASGPHQPAVEREFRIPPAPGQMRGQFSQLLVDYLNRQGADDTLTKIAEHVEREIAAWVAQKKAAQLARGNLPPKLKLASEQRPSFEPNNQGNRPLIFREAP
jgi:hypothetical protein